jgi:hypothetical protein
MNTSTTLFKKTLFSTQPVLKRNKMDWFTSGNRLPGKSSFVASVLREYGPQSFVIIVPQDKSDSDVLRDYHDHYTSFFPSCVITPYDVLYDISRYQHKQWLKSLVNWYEPKSVTRKVQRRTTRHYKKRKKKTNKKKKNQRQYH